MQFTATFLWTTVYNKTRLGVGHKEELINTFQQDIYINKKPNNNWQ